MKQFILISDNEEMPSELEQRILETANLVMQSGAKSFAMIANLPEGEYATAYCNLGAIGLADVAERLRFEAIDSFIRANIKRYAALAEDEENNDDDEEGGNVN